MNPSKPTLRQRLLRYLPYLILLGWFVICTGFLGHWGNGSYDFERSYYVPGAAIKSDWFPPIVWLELRLYDLLQSGEYSAAVASKIFVCVWTFALLAAALLITRSLMRTQRSPYPFIFCLIVVYNPIWVHTWQATIDLAVAAFLCLALATIHLLEAKKGWTKALLIAAVVAFAILHRKNAIICLPALCLYATYTLTQPGKHFYLRWVGLAAGASLAFVVAMNVVYYGVLDIKKSHSENTMLQSDIYCMDLLQGKEPCARVSERIGCGPFRCPSTQASNEYNVQARYSLRRPGHIVGNPLWTEEENKIWKDEWLQRVQHDPICFLMVRAVLTCQHFNQGLCPPFLTKIVQMRYPDTQISLRSSYAYDLPWPYIPAPRIIKLAFRQALITVYLLSLVILPFVYLRKRRELSQSGMLRLSLAAYAVALSYTLSLIPCVPTPDARYLTPQVAVWAFAIGALLTHMLRAQPQK